MLLLFAFEVQEETKLVKWKRPFSYLEVFVNKRNHSETLRTERKKKVFSSVDNVWRRLSSNQNRRTTFYLFENSREKRRIYTYAHTKHGGKRDLFFWSVRELAFFFF